MFLTIFHNDCYLCNLYIPIIVVLFGALYGESDPWYKDFILRDNLEFVYGLFPNSDVAPVILG